MKLRFEETDEVRCPLEGEYFKEPSGFINRAMFNFNNLKFPIMKMILEAEGNETRGHNKID